MFLASQRSPIGEVMRHHGPGAGSGRSRFWRAWDLEDGANKGDEQAKLSREITSGSQRLT